MGNPINWVWDCGSKCRIYDLFDQMGAVKIFVVETMEYMANCENERVIKYQRQNNISFVEYSFRHTVTRFFVVSILNTVCRLGSF